MKEKRTKGYIPFYDRKRCEDYIFIKWLGNGSLSQKTTYCTKIEPYFIITLDDVCDEFDENKL